ncbi:MAG: GyrI-like domain-containing protein [Anaerolineae bacterium]|nr:GyrI-like domain-containing protein [Anaerolineae bacterium]
MTMVTDLHFIELPDMRVISAHGYGEGPEGIAIQKLLQWIDARGLRAEISKQRFFGFNNPDPAVGSPNYGYEQWMTLPEEYSPQEGDDIKTLKGGLFAVMGFRNSTPESFGTVWPALSSWRIETGHVYDGSRQWLEECLTPLQMFGLEPGLDDFDCYMPILKK